MFTTASGNPKTGAASATIGKFHGHDDSNAQAGVFAEQNGKKDTVNKGVYGAVKTDNLDLSLKHGHKNGFGSSITAGAQANLYKTKNENQKKQDELNATAHFTKARTHEAFGGGLNMQTAGGHSAALGVNHIPQYNMTTMQASGTANLLSSPSGNLNLGATANATRHMSGPFSGKTDIFTGLNVDYKF